MKTVWIQHMSAWGQPIKGNGSLAHAEDKNVLKISTRLIHKAESERMEFQRSALHQLEAQGSSRWARPIGPTERVVAFYPAQHRLCVWFAGNPGHLKLAEKVATSARAKLGLPSVHTPALPSPYLRETRRQWRRSHLRSEITRVKRCARLDV
jgi:hypothetical protein